MVCIFRVEDLLGHSSDSSTHQGLDFREVSGALGGLSGPGRGVGVTRQCPSMPLTPDLDSDSLRPSPPRSQSQPSDLTQVKFTNEMITVVLMFNFFKFSSRQDHLHLLFGGLLLTTLYFQKAAC